IRRATAASAAAEPANKANSSPSIATSMDGAQGVLMNISGGTSLSLFEVQEAADLVTSAADDDVNVIFGNVINENLKEEVIVTVIATGFDEAKKSRKQQPLRSNAAYQQTAATRPTEQRPREQPVKETVNHDEDTLDIPTLLRNRNRKR